MPQKRFPPGGRILGLLTVMACAVGMFSQCAAQQESSSFEWPLKISLESTTDSALPLYRLGACCVHRTITDHPPEIAMILPREMGKLRRYTTLELGLSTLLVMYESLENEIPVRHNGELLVRVDSNQNFNLTDDEVYRCQLSRLCGPVQTQIQHEHGKAPYEFWLEVHHMGGRWDVLWYSRAMALQGSLDGRRIVILDNDTNGEYNDPEDIVAFDRNGDGVVSEDPTGFEWFPRRRVLTLGGENLRIVDVDPVKSQMLVDRAGKTDLDVEVLDVRTGRGIGGALVRVHPGSFEATTDEKGRARVVVLEGQPDRVSVVAPGYWSTVHGPGQESADISESKEGTASYRFLLHKGPCRNDPEVHWCGRETLLSGSVENSHLDLEHGVVGPRVGGVPGARDIGWYGASPGLVMTTPEGARLDVLPADVKFEDVTLETLAKLDLDRERLVGGSRCGLSAPLDGELHHGTVLAVRSHEGRLGKIRINDCRAKLDLTWILYEKD